MRLKRNICMKVCFVGLGSIGKRHICNFSAVCEAQGVALEVHALRKTATPLPDYIQNRIHKVLLSYVDLDSAYDAIFILNPTYLHYDTLKALQSYSNCFFIEKPVFDKASYDLSVFDNKNRYYVACPLRYTKELLCAEQVIKDEQVFSARAISSSYLPNWRPGVDYRTTYSAHASEGGGVRIDLIHEWDYLVHLFGKPEQVVSYSGLYSDLEIDSEDIAVYIARYKKMLVELHLDYFGRKTRRSLECRTANHEYVFDIAEHKVLCDGNVLQSDTEDVNGMYMREMEHFLNVILKKNKPKNTIQSAIDVMRIAGTY